MRLRWFALICIWLTWLPLLNAATITTDRTDYSPYTLVSISGTGFQPGETVDNQILQAAGPAPGTVYGPWIAQADTNGNFTTSWLVFSDDFLGTTLQLSATGRSSGLSASTTFTDSVTCPGLQTGVAPINSPTGGFGIDGDLLANAPTQGIGDWLPDSSGLGGVLSAAGCPLNGVTTYHLLDAANSSVDDNFSTGKVDDNPNTWTWVLGPVGNKVDLKHALIHTAKDSKGHVWVVVGATRQSNNGDAYVDFEFLQNPLTVVTNATGTGGSFSSAGPNGGRTINDFVLAITLTGGGTTPNLCVYRWNQVGVDTSGNPLYDYTNATAALPANAVFGAMNTAPVSIPSCYSNVVDTYAANDFGEVAVDVTAMIGGFDPCATASIGTIFVKSKQSQSPSAQLGDFMAPQAIYQPIILGPAALAGPNQAKCAQGNSTSFTLAGAVQQGTLPLTSTNWTVVSGFATIDQPGSLAPTVTVYGAGTNVTLRLSVADSGACANSIQHSDVVLTVNPLPACSITGDDATFDGSLGNTYSGPAGMANYAWSVSGNDSVTINGSATAQTVKLDVAPNASLTSSSFTLSLALVDTNGCSSTCQKLVTIETAIQGCLIQGPAVVCAGSTGNQYILGSKPASATSYSWSIIGNGSFDTSPAASATTVSIDAGAPGSFTVQVIITFNGGATTTCSFPVTVEQLALGIAAENDVTCYAGNNGSLTASASAGTPPYSYSLDGVNFQPSGTFSGLAAGNYTVTATDSVGCLSATTATIGQPTSAVALIATVTQPKCNTDTGSINASASGGTGAITYSKDGTSFQPTGFFIGLAPGNYTITAKDANGCIATMPLTINAAPSPIMLTALATQPKCSTDSGSINASASGGTGSITYSKDGTTFQATGLFIGLPAGNYTITAQDANGCTATMPLTINAAPSAITLTAIATQPKCSTDTGSINASATGGMGTITYSKDGTSFQDNGLFAGLAAGNYNITAKDANGCTATMPLTINAAPSAIALTATVTQSLCPSDNGSITASASGGTGTITYSRDGTTFQATGSFSGLAAGIYTITAKDSNGCTATIPVTVATLSTISLSAVATQPKCSTDTGSINSSASGGTGTLSYSKDGTAFQPTGSFTGLAAGNYTITARDANGCTASTQLTINAAPPAITLTATAIQPKCSTDTGSINASASGGSGTLSYSKDGTTFQPTGLFTGLAAGNYTITARDANGCTASTQLTINAAPPAITLIGTAIQPKCSTDTGSINASASGGSGTLSYSKDGTAFQPTGSFTGLASGNYTIIAKDANGCTTSTQLTINAAPPAIILNATATQPTTSTVTGSINASASGGTGTITYSKDGTTFQATGLFSGLAEGTYTITAKDANGCTATTSVYIDPPQGAMAMNISIVQPKCSSDTGSITASASGGTSPYTYSINGTTFQSSGTFDGLQAKTYTVTAKDSSGLTCSQQATITQPPAISCAISGLSDVQVGSTGNTFTATAGGGTPPYSFAWSCNNPGWTITSTISETQSTTVTYSAPDQDSSACLTVKTTDANGCTAVCTVTVSCAPPGIVTDSGLCTFPSPFRLIFTHDPTRTDCSEATRTGDSDDATPMGSSHDSTKQGCSNTPPRPGCPTDPLRPGCYKLTASNPGQFFYNMTYQGTPGERTATFYITLPYPFVTQGARPIHAYDSVTIHKGDEETCLSPGNGILVSSRQVTLVDYGPNPVVGVTTYTFTETVPLSPLGFAYLNIHLDYGLKKFGGYTPGGTSGDDAISCSGSSVIPIPDFVANHLFYTFGYKVGTGGVNTLTSVQSTNDFGNIPGSTGGGRNDKPRDPKPCVPSRGR